MKAERYISPSLFLSVFALYLIYLCPVIFSGDSPLLAASAFSLEPAHPPGYPLYVMLGKAFTLLPLGSVAFKVNLMSALSGATAAVLVYLSVRTLTEDHAASIFAALLSALVPLAWAESTKAEVYTLNSALAMSIFYLGIKFLKEDPDRRLLFGMSFVLGLGMGNHHTIGFMVFPLAVAALLRVREMRTLIYCLLFFSAGISIYLFSHIRSLTFQANEALFAYSDSSSLKKLLDTFFRKEYQSSIGVVTAPARDPLSFLRGAYNAVRYLIYGNMWLFSFLAFFSVPVLWRRKGIFSFAAVTFLSYAVVLSAMVYAFKEPSSKDVFLLNPYMLPVLYITSLLAGLGAFFVLRTVHLRLPDLRRPLALGLVLLPLVFTLPESLKKHNASDYYLSEDFSENVLEILPPETIYIVDSDSSYFPLTYKRFVEKKRDDVLLVFSDESIILTQSSPIWSYESVFPDLPKTGSFYPIDKSYLEDRQLFAFDVLFLSRDFLSGYRVAPFVNSYRLVPREHQVGRAYIEKDFRDAFELFAYERGQKERATDVYSTELKMSFFISLARYAYILKNEGDLKRSREYYEKAILFITKKGVVHYMEYLKAADLREEVEAFVEAIEPYAEKYSNIRKLSDEIKRQYL